MGESVQTVGDLNGDGYSEVAIGSPDDYQGEAGEGMVFIHFGSENGIKTQPDWIGEGNLANAHFGISLRGTGDVNGDGINDLLVGATGFGNEQGNNGKVFLYYGTSEGFGDEPIWVIEGSQQHASFGYAFDFIGDVNGDGAFDFVISAPLYGETDEGRVHAYSVPTATNTITPTPTSTYTVTPTYTATVPTKTLTPTNTATIPTKTLTPTRTPTPRKVNLPITLKDASNYPAPGMSLSGAPSSDSEDPSYPAPNEDLLTLPGNLNSYPAPEETLPLWDQILNFFTNLFGL